MQKKLLTLLIFNDEKNPSEIKSDTLGQLESYADRIEIICHSLKKSVPEGITDVSVSDYGRFIKFASNVARGKYVAILPPDVTVYGEDLGALLKLIEKPCDNIISFGKAHSRSCIAIEAKFFKNLCQSASPAQLVNIPLHAYIAAKTCKKANILPFDFGNDQLLKIADSNAESFFSSLITAVKGFNAPRNRTSSLMYKACFDALYASVSAAYEKIVRTIASDKGFASAARKFDDELKAADLKIYEYAERNFKLAPLKKLRDNGFAKLPLLTAVRLTLIKK